MQRSTMTVESQPPPEQAETLVLEVAGMTCGSCAARLQRMLSRQEGVAEVCVNFATGRATVAFVRDAADGASLVAAVERIGYRARPLTAAGETDRGSDAAHARETAVWRRRALVAWPPLEVAPAAEF